MLLGFLSLLLTVGTSYIAKICVPEKIGYKMLPCKPEYYKSKGDGSGDDDDNNDHEGKSRRKLLNLAEEMIFRRVLAASSDDVGTCGKVWKFCGLSNFFLSVDRKSMNCSIPKVLIN